MLPKIVLASQNPGKLAELRSVLSSLPVTVLPYPPDGPPFPEETGSTFAENAATKAFFAADVTHRPALADDSGLVVPCLDGAPGVHSARFAGPHATDAQRIEKLLAMLEDLPFKKRGPLPRNAPVDALCMARFECVLALVEGDQIHYFAGSVAGLILDSPRGAEGFGFDPVFFYPPLNATFSQITREAKNNVSHRGQALAELKSFLMQLDMCVCSH